MLTTDQILDRLRRMPDGLKPLFDMADGQMAPLVKTTLTETDMHGNRLRLVCGVEFVEDDEYETEGDE